MEKEDYLKEKAIAFFKEAEYDISQKNWFLAAFHLEQSLQIFLKHCLFKKLGDFPKIHSLNALLKEVEKVFPQAKDKILKIRKEKANIISDLNQAYISACYLPVEFNKFQVQNMYQFSRKLLEFLEKLCKKH